MLSFDEARTRILDAVPAPTVFSVPLDQAAGYVLATPVTARHDQPPFAASAMDGYAVRAEDIEVGTPYPVIGESQAGSSGDLSLGSRQTARIFTGAPVPKHANAVIIQENAARNGDQVTFSEPAEPGQNIRPQGLDFASGETLLAPGIPMNPARIALAAAANVAQVEVFKKPRIALLSTGDELVPPGSKLKPGQIVSSNSLALNALFAPYAEHITDFGIIPDDEATLRQAFENALQSDTDFIITSGGASVGDHDLVQPVLKSLGVEVGFWKIAMRPGKPLMFGKSGNKLILALPGNPVSAYATAFLLVLPALRRAAGYTNPVTAPMHLPLASPLGANGPRRHFIRGKLVDLNGQTHVRPHAQTDSSHLSTLANSDVILVQHENSTALNTGEIVDTFLLP